MRILIITLSLLVLVSCTRDAAYQSDDTDAPTVAKKQYEFSLEKVSPKIRNTHEFNSCMQPAITTCMTQVGNDIAKQQGSPDFCNEISNVTSQNACKYGVIIPRVIESGDTKLCDTLSEEFREDCMATYIIYKAQKSGLPKDCNDLAKLGNDSQSRLNQCYTLSISSSRTSTTQDCRAIPGDVERNNCIKFINNRNTQ